jgi:hypothetical protein
MNVTFVSGYVLSDEKKLISLVLFCFNFLLLLILSFLLPFNFLSLLTEQMTAAVTLRLLILLERDAFRNWQVYRLLHELFLSLSMRMRGNYPQKRQNRLFPSSTELPL